KRMSYDKVQEVLDGKGAPDYLAYQDLLTPLAALCRARQSYRSRRGAINFDFPEPKVITDEKTGEVVDIIRRHQALAEQVIEEAMICANEAVATEYERREIPFMYRVHLGPAGDKLTALNAVLSPLGHPLPIREIEPKDVQQVLEAMADSPYRPLVELATLRSMPHAYYDIEAKGHFGLASKYYSHFTSPIRRYADLSIHRVIREFPKGKPVLEEKAKKQLENLLSEAALAASLTEKNAESAEREAIDLLSCKYMAKHIGEEFCGVISGSNNYGLYVELDNTVEGMIPLASLPPDDYTFSAASLTLQGQRQENRFALGDRLKVRVERADVALRRIDFAFVERTE
ncbi:MAG: RNB domain-containing ribonuclease, partial [Clostridiales bacterium]